MNKWWKGGVKIEQFFNHSTDIGFKWLSPDTRFLEAMINWCPHCKGFRVFMWYLYPHPCLVWKHWLRYNRWEVLVWSQKYEWGGSYHSGTARGNISVDPWSALCSWLQRTLKQGETDSAAWDCQRYASCFPHIFLLCLYWGTATRDHCSEKINGLCSCLDQKIGKEFNKIRSLEISASLRVRALMDCQYTEVRSCND